MTGSIDIEIARVGHQRTVDDQAEGAFFDMLAEEDDRAVEVRVDELRHRQEQARRE